jgi:hypothetical protein
MRQWQPLPHHAAFENVLNGGINRRLLDCHELDAAIPHARAWPAGLGLCDRRLRDAFASDAGRPPVLCGWPVSAEGDRVVVDAELSSGGIITATCRGTFVAVGPDHPAYERW